MQDAPGVHEAVVEVGGGAEGLSHPLVGHDHAGPLGQATPDGGQGTDGVTHVVERLEHAGEVERAYAGPGGGVAHLEAHPVGHAGSDGMARSLFDRGLVEVDPEQACGGQRPGQGDGRPTRPAAHVEDTGLGQSPELPAHAGSSGQPRPDVVDEHGPVHPEARCQRAPIRLPGHERAVRDRDVTGSENARERGGDVRYGVLGAVVVHDDDGVDRTPPGARWPTGVSSAGQPGAELGDDRAVALALQAVRRLDVGVRPGVRIR